MASIGRHGPMSQGLNVILLMVFDFILTNHVSASKEVYEEKSYFVAWDFAVDWETAWQLCNSRNSTLPAIRNKIEQDSFQEFLNVQTSGSVVWTSGRNYTYDNLTWLDGRPYSSREYEHLSSGYQRYKPVAYFDFEFIEYENPRFRIPYVCQYSEDLCNRFNDTFNIKNGCVKESVDRRSWYDARNQCIKTGGDLAVLDYADKRLLRHNDLPRRFNVWIGFRRTSWRWNLNRNASEEDEVKLTNWAKDWDPLTGDCISINASNGTWRSIECSDKLKVVCQTDFAKKTSSKPDNPPLSEEAEQDSQTIISLSAFISVVIVCMCVCVISNIIVAIGVRKCANHRNAQVSSDRETSVEMGYQDLGTTQRQANADGTYTSIQLQPVYEEVCQRGN